MPSVFPHWMADLPMQQQSVLVLALRGPDGIRKHHPCKDVVRAYRGSVLMAAKFGRSLDFGEAADTFMSMDKIAVPPEWEAAMRAFFEHIDELPHHYIAHLMHGAHILACHHPSRALKDRWRWFYRCAVDDAHLLPEPDEVMNERLGDWGRRHWDGAASSPLPAPQTLPRATGAATREDAGRGSGEASECDDRRHLEARHGLREEDLP